MEFGFVIVLWSFPSVSAKKRRHSADRRRGVQIFSDELTNEMSKIWGL